MKAIIISVLLMMSLPTFSKEVVNIENVGSLIDSQIKNTQQTLETVNEMTFSTVRLRVRPKISLEISGIAKAKLEPELELYFTK